jgi:glycosyltransferase involved in cell wall biosynthesis
MFIPIGVDLSRFTALGSKVPEYHSEAQKVVLSVSRLVAHKRLDVFIRAAHEISLRREGYMFLIVGEGPERDRLQGLVDSYGMRDSVLLGGGVIEEELPAYYRTASVFVITEPAIDEFWITALESMGCGTPVIAPSSGGHLELIEGCGLVFTPGDAVSLAGRITEICEDERLRLALKDEMGKRIVKFDWNRAIRSYEEAYCRASLTKLAKANERADSHLTASMDAARRAMLRCRRPTKFSKPKISKGA